MLSLGIKLSDPSVSSTRCGVVPYTFRRDKLYFLFGRDRSTGELGDFGGGVKKGERVLFGGWREWMQETKGIFASSYDNVNSLSNKLALVSPQMTIIFVPVSPEWIEKAPKLFMNTVLTDKQSNEMSELVWLEEASFRHHVTSRGSRMIWKKVKTFFQENYIPKKDIGYWLHHIYLS